MINAKKIQYLMKRIFIIVAAALMAGCGGAGRQESGETKKMDCFVGNLMKQMTVEEKIGQLNLMSIDGAVLTGPAAESNTGEMIRRNEVGAILNVPSVEKIRELQELAVASSRFGIPLLFGMDVIHGYKTIFPIPLGMAATWNMESVERMARISAVEASAAGICWTYSPMVDISHDARWGRVAEGAGEDPFLGGEIAKAYVRGYQGDLSRNDNIMACVKHYALYDAPEGGKDYNTVDMSRQRMFNEYMEPYRAAVEAGVGSVMSAFNEVEGIPAGANRWLLTDVLRTEWGFDGFVVADWDAVREMTVHGIGDLGQVSARALKAGLDMDMASQGFTGTLRKSLDEGKVSLGQIDIACRRILEAKYKLGLFDDPFKYCDPERVKTDILTPGHRAEARRIAAESFVLLKNAGDVLPLKKQGRIAVVGPLADNRANMLGTWTVAADQSVPVTVLEGVTEALKGRAEVVYAKGSNLTYDPELERRAGHDGKVFTRDGRSDTQLAEEALSAARRSDVVVAVMGEAAEMSGEASSRTDLNIPDAQKDLLRKLTATGKPVVLVLFTGRPLTLVWEDANVDAILNVWFPGTEAGPAIADVLFGDTVPGGKLTSTFPRSVGQVPIRYNYRTTGRPPHSDSSISKYTTGYIDQLHTPLYPFGYGLSYTTFEYGDVRLDKSEMTADGTIRATIEVSNSGGRAGSEVVQMYIRDIAGSVTRPVKELKGFEKIYLEPGESRTVEFTLTADMLRFWNYDMEYVWEQGDFEVMVGGNSRDVKSTVFTLN